jgi:hypothetical protein
MVVLVSGDFMLLLIYYGQIEKLLCNFHLFVCVVGFIIGITFYIITDYSLVS